MMQCLTILIDGYNVSRNMGGSRLEDGVTLATARENLLAMVRSRFRGTPYKVIVVFDGAGERETCEPLKGLAPGSQYIFTQCGTLADAVIVRLSAQAAAAGDAVRVCTNDLEVRDATTPHGATHTPVAEMVARLNAPDRHTEKRLKHAAYVRRELDGSADDAPRSHSGKGNPRRAPKKQRGRGERSW
jgi:predicted RNA-binding protein with PIN domain